MLRKCREKKGKKVTRTLGMRERVSAKVKRTEERSKNLGTRRKRGKGVDEKDKKGGGNWSDGR